MHHPSNAVHPAVKVCGLFRGLLVRDACIYCSYLGDTASAAGWCILQACITLYLNLKKNTSRWHELHLHNDILISSLFIITLVVIVRVVIHSAAVQATGNKVNRQGQKSVQMFPGNKMFLCVESSNSIPIAFKSCPLHNCSNVTGQRDSGRERCLHWPYRKNSKLPCSVHRAGVKFIDESRVNVSLKEEMIESVRRAAASPIHETGERLMRKPFRTLL